MKVRCPNPEHPDNTPSAYAYEDGVYCFTCNRKFSPVEGAKKTKKRPPENIQASISRIKELPLTKIRGLDLYGDSGGYYVLWPDSSYYKYRLSSEVGNGDKYRNPTGHSQPLLCFGDGTGKTLLVIEGEINAMTAYTVTEGMLDTVSPGSAGNFEKLREELLVKCHNYDQVLVWCDQDPAGLSALIKFSGQLLAKYPEKRLQQVYRETDLNDLYVDMGHVQALNLIKELIGRFHE